MKIIFLKNRINKLSLKDCRTFLLISSVFIFGNISAQEIKISWGPECKMKSDEVLTGIIGESGSVLYTTKIKSAVFSNDEFYIQKFDAKTMQMLGSVPLLLTDAVIKEGVNEAKPEFEKVILLNDRLLLFLTAYDKARDMNIAYAQTFDSEDNPKALLNLDRISGVKKYNRGNFDFVISKDGSRILLVQSMPFQKHQNEEFAYRLYDSDLKLLWSKKFKLPYKNNNFGIIKYALDKNEDVVMLAKIDKEKNMTIKEEPSYYYTLLEYSPSQNETVEEYEVNLPGKYITDISFELDNKNQILVTGFYANDSRNGINGSFFMRIDRHSNKVISSSIKPFEKDLMLEFIEERKLNRGQGLSGFNMNEMIIREDGSVLVVAEQYYMREICNRDARGFIYCNYYYYYNSIMVLNIDSLGQIVWNATIPKFQNSMNDNGYYLSYALGVTPDKLHFIYLDNPKNTGISDPKYYKVMSSPYGKSVPVHVTLNADGTFVKEAMLNDKNQAPLLRPKFCRQLNGSELIMMGMAGGNRFRLGRFSLIN